jgi:flagellar biosynthesis GTPase FlhF
MLVKDYNDLALGAFQCIEGKICSALSIASGQVLKISTANVCVVFYKNMPSPLDAEGDAETGNAAQEAETDAKDKAEEEAKAKAEEEAKAKAEEEAKAKAEEEAKAKAEEEAKAKAEEEAKAKAEEEAKAKAEEEAKDKAEADAKDKAEATEREVAAKADDEAATESNTTEAAEAAFKKVASIVIDLTEVRPDDDADIEFVGSNEEGYELLRRLEIVCGLEVLHALVQQVTLLTLAADAEVLGNLHLRKDSQPQ